MYMNVAAATTRRREMNGPRLGLLGLYRLTVAAAGGERGGGAAARELITATKRGYRYSSERKVQLMRACRCWRSVFREEKSRFLPR